MSNPEVRKIAAERLRKWLAACPESTYFQIGEGDNHNWCRCPECRKLDPKRVDCIATEYPYNIGKHPGHLVDRMLNFINYLGKEVAADFPDKKLMVLAYQGTVQLPRREKLADNVVVLLCPSPMAGNICFSHYSCSRNKVYWKAYKDWMRFAGKEKIAVYEYLINFKNIYAPFFCLDNITARIKRYHKDGIDKIGFNGHPYLFAELYQYVLGKLLWRPELDAEELEKEFLKVYYGPAAGEMSELLALLRRKISNPRRGLHQTNFGLMSPLVDVKYCSSAYGIFDRAEKAAAEDAKILWRVRYAKLCAVLWADLDQMKNSDPLPKLRELAAICREAPDPRLVRHLTSNTGKEFKSWSSEHFGFELDEKTWLDDPRFKK